MSDKCAVTQITISPRVDQVVGWGGRIEREVQYYAIEWTESRNGWIDTAHEARHSDPDDIAAIVGQLVKRLRRTDNA